jgi:hypothetical protein
MTRDSGGLYGKLDCLAHGLMKAIQLLGIFDSYSRQGADAKNGTNQLSSHMVGVGGRLALKRSDNKSRHPQFGARSNGKQNFAALTPQPVLNPSSILDVTRHWRTPPWLTSIRPHLRKSRRIPFSQHSRSVK